jgi:hypothetical protein
VYELVRGGHFLIHRVDVTVGDSPVRTLRVAADRHTMSAVWERTDDGKTWRTWMDIRFTRD